MKKMGNSFKRFLALALAVFMVVGMMPTNIAFATEDEGETTTCEHGVVVSECEICTPPEEPSEEPSEDDTTTCEHGSVASECETCNPPADPSEEPSEDPSEEPSEDPDAGVNPAADEGDEDEPEVTSVTIDGVVYIIDGTQNAQVTNGKAASGDIVIPEKVTIGGAEYTVTTIAGNAFNDANEVTSVEVPNSVTTLGGAAFANMDALKTLKIGNGVTSWGSKLAVNNYELETVVIAEGATLIGDLAFRTCPKLANVTLPSTLKTIGATAFAYAAITELNIPASVTTIGADAFKDIDTLKKVTFNSVPANFGTTVFQMCDGLETVVLPEGLTSIPQGTFRYCTSLKNINFPESLTEIGNYSFQGCTSLESVTISKNITNLVTNAFNGCTSLKNLTIEEGFAGTIGGYVFQGCTALESVVIPSSMETVGESMFNGCTSLKNVTLSEGVKTLNISAFANCTSLETLVLPDSLERMRHGSIANCTGLKTLVITGENLPIIEHSNALDGLSEDLVVVYTGDDEFTGNWAALENNFTKAPMPWYDESTYADTAEFVIDTVAELQEFATLTRNGVNFKGKTVKLGADIDLSGTYWIDVNVDGTVVADYRIVDFAGTLDGNSKTIKNISFRQDQVDGGYGLCFFRTVYGTIKNLTLDGISAIAAGNANVYAINSIATSNSSKPAEANLVNVHVKNATVNIDNDESSSGYSQVAGMVRWAGKGTYAQNCSVTNLNATVTGKAVAGGFSAFVAQTSEFYNCDVTNFTLNAGSVAYGVGGFGGQVQSSSYVQRVFNDCDVTNVDITVGYLDAMVGGFLGNLGGPVNCDDCDVTGKITIKSDIENAHVGGFTGDLGWQGDWSSDKIGHTFDNCTADVDITAVNSDVGGFVGMSAIVDNTVLDQNQAFAAVFTNCAASGDVTTVNGAAGGFVGSGDRGEYVGCTASGAVNGAIAGGFWGEIFSMPAAPANGNTGKGDAFTGVVISGCTASENVNGTTYEAGLIGAMDNVDDGEAAYTTPVTLTNNSSDEVNDLNAKTYPVMIGTQGYETLKEAVEAANAVEGGATVTVLKDVTLGEKLTIEGNVTISGAYTITRDAAYTGTLFTVNAGATLTLDGGLVIDGANEWTLNTELYNQALNREATGVTWADLITSEEGKPEATAPMFKVTGSVVANNVTIQNNYSSKDSNNGDYGVFQVDANATLTMTGATIKHIVTGGANSVAHLSTNSVWTINEGTLITDTFAGKNGGVCRNDSGKLVMNGGEISNNNSINTNGTVVMLYKGSMEMNGGKICSNTGISGTNNGRCAPIYGHSTSTFIMTDGEICHNTGISYGGVDVPSSIKVEISGGYIGENISVIGNTNADVNGNANTVISGGTFTQDVSAWLAPNTGLAYDEETGTYSVTDHVYNLWFRDPVTGEQLDYVGPLEGNDAASLVATGKGFYANYYVMELEVLSNVKIDETIVIDYPMTVNLNGHTITTVATDAGDYMDAFTILADVTVTGEGKINARPSHGYTFYIGDKNGNAGNLTIENGTFYGETSVVNNRLGTVTINGGNFAISLENEGDDYRYLLNCIDANYNAGTAKIVVKGGTFYKFNPADNEAETGDHTNFVAEGYEVSVNGEYYTVSKAKNFVAQVGGDKYETLADAIAAAQAGDTITFLTDITEDVTVGKSLTIDGANFKYTGNISVSGTSSAVTVKNVNFVDGTGYAITTNRIKSITVENCTVSNYGYGFLYANKSTPTVVVKNVTVENCNYGFHWVYGTSATLEDVTMTNVTNGLLIQNYAAKTITLKNCDISSIEIWEKATADQIFNFEGANTVGKLSNSQYAKYVLTAADATLTAPEGATVTTSVEGNEAVYADGTYSVCDYIEWIKAELLAGNDVTLDRDIVLDDISYVTSEKALSNGNGKYCGFDYGNGAFFNVIGGDVTFDLNGHSITYDIHDDAWCNKRVVSIFYATDKANLTVIDNVGTGAVTVNGMATAVYSVAAGTKVTISGGTWTWNPCGTCGATNVFLYASHGGELYITGGSFTSNVKGDSGEYMIMSHYSSKETTENWAGVDYDSTKIEISGGTFGGYNPEEIKFMDNGNGNAETMDNAVAKGYEAVDNGDGTWSVSQIMVVEMDGVKYPSIKDALWTLKSADTTVHTVKVLQDHEIDVNYSTYNYPILVNGFAIELDLNGKTITADWGKYTGSRVDNALIGVCNGGKLTVIDSVGGGKIVNNDDKADVENRIFWIMTSTATKSIEVNIKGGTFVQNDTNTALLYVQGNKPSDNLAPMYVTISGGHFESVNTDFFNAYDGFQHESYITGGTFDKDPTDGEIKIAEGYKVEQNEDGTWTVQKFDYVAWVKEQLLAGNDVTLDRDIVVDGSYIESIPAPTNSNGKYPNYGIFNVVGDYDVTFDLNGHTITYNGHADFEWNGKTYNSCTVAHGLFFANAGADLTVIDSSEAKTGTVMVYGLASGAYAASPDTIFTITGGTWKNEGCKTCGGTNLFLYPLQGAELYITGGTFEQAPDTNGDSYLLVNGNGEYKNSVIDYSKTKLVITGGTFVGMNPEEARLFFTDASNKTDYTRFTNACAKGYKSEQNEDGTWTVVPNKIFKLHIIDPNTNEPATIPYIEGNDLASVVAEGKLFYANYYNMVLEILGDWELDEGVVIDYPMTIDLGGNTLTTTDDVNPAIRVLADVTVKNGKMNTAGYCFIVGNGDGVSGNLTIESGSYTGLTTVASVTKGTLTVAGGTFATSEGDYGATYLLNCIDANVKDGTAKIVVKGGTFVGFNPEDNAAENPKVNFCAEGYGVEQDGENYIVKPVITVTFDNLTMVEGNELPEFTWTSNFTEVSEDGEMLVVGNPEVAVNGVGEYEIAAEAYVFMSDKYIVKVVPGTLTVVEAVAEANGVVYGSIEAAINAVATNNSEPVTIKVLKDHVIDTKGESYAVIRIDGKNVKIDLNGCTVTFDYESNENPSAIYASMYVGPIRIGSSFGGGTLVICDSSKAKTGTIHNKGDNGAARIVWCATNGTTTIESGNFVNEQKDTMFYTSVTTGYYVKDTVLTIKGGTFKQVGLVDGIDNDCFNMQDATASKQDIVLTGGTFHYESPKAGRQNDWEVTIPKGYKVVENGDGTWTVEPNMIFEMHLVDANGEAHWLSPMRSNDLNGVIEKSKIWYDSLQGTYDFTLKVLESYELDETVLATFPMTIDLCGNTLTVAETMNATPAIRVLSDVTVTNGTVDATAGSSTYAFIVGNNDTAGTLNIADGTYKGCVSAISVTKGTLNISGGNFESTIYNDAYEFQLNCIDANYKNGSAVINVTGGTFAGFNPEDNAAEGAGTNFVAEGYEAVDNGDNTWTVVEDALFDIAGANIVAGNKLDMYFYVLTEDLDGETNYYALINRTMEDGTVVTKNIPYSEWETYDSTRMRFMLDGMVAKEMTDKITVQVFKADGTEASNLWNDSIKDYAMRTMKKTTNAESRTVLVDMLNYGAAAQDFFGYRTDDLANADLGEYAQYATQSIEWADSRIKGTNYKGTTVSCKSNLILTMYFENITSDMYAIAMYTNHYCEEKTVRIEGEDFYFRSSTMIGVDVDTLVVADGDTLVSVTVYDADGNEVASASDSIISYAYRQQDGHEVYKLMAYFSASAHEYFH